jgi:O-antigen/teichoic acid export membrane protein
MDDQITDEIKAANAAAKAFNKITASAVASEKRGKKLRQSVLTLSFSNAVEMAVQVLLPIVLVRLLSEADFGLYRTLWLIAFTCSGTLALGMPGSLYYFLPRLNKSQSSSFLLQTAGFMLLVSGVAAVGTAAFVAMNESGQAIGVSAIVFVFLWVFASLLDYVFNAHQAAATQAKVNLSFAVLRVILVLGSALIFKDWAAVMAAQLILVALKGTVCALSVAHFARPVVKPTRETMLEQGRYSLPFGISTGLYLLRGRVDQWLVASLFTVTQFGLYSIASIFTPIQSLVRMTINQVVLPEMSRMQSQSNDGEMQALNRRCNLAVGLLMFPMLAFLATWAEPILSLLFTDRYNAAAPVLRVYLLGMLIESIEVAWIMVAMRQGRFMMINDAIALPISIAAAYLGAKVFGLPGAAAGGIAGVVAAQIILYRRCSKLTGLPLSGIQDWPGLARIALASVLAALVSFGTRWLGLQVPLFFQLLVAGLVFVATYLSVLRLLGSAATIRAVLGLRFAKLAGF